MDRAASSVSSKGRIGRRPAKADRRERQIVRVLALLRALSQGRTTTVYELATEFGTRRETIYRDLRVLQDAGYPITGEGGRLSRPQLLPGSIPEIRFSPSELKALQAAAQQVQVALPTSTALGTASSKLEALLHLEQKHAPAARSELIQSWACGTKEYSVHETHIARLLEAILRRRRCRVEYRKPGSAPSKKYNFDPYRLLVVNGGLYVVGKVSAYEGVATLAVDRLLSVTLSVVEFSIDTDFDPEQCRAQAFGVSWEKPRPIVLHFRADQAPYVRERIWHPTQQLRPLPDGALEMSFHAGGPFEIRRWILGWGDAVEVISPGDLREDVERAAKATFNLYS